MNTLIAQFAHPHGLLGSMAGWLMHVKNRKRNLWTLQLLNLQPADKVLEVGYGPGWAIGEAARNLPQGHVTGIDASATMFHDASRRNVGFIRQGRVRLALGTESPLPFGLRTFDKYFAVNSFQFWNEPQRGLQEARRVLKPGGRAAITVQPMWANTATEAERYADVVLCQVAEAGFAQVRLERLRLRPLCFCIVAEA